MAVSERSNKAVLAETPAQNGRPKVVFRSAGDRFLLAEFGEMALDLTLNFRVLGLNQRLKDAAIDGVIETVPALRSIMVHYDSTTLAPATLIAAIEEHYAALPPVEDLSIPSRAITLPLAVDDQWTRADIARYVQYIRKDAPNIINGNNIEYAAMYNGLPDAEAFVETFMATPWWNAANGFFPGLPFMFPLDPRYAVVIPKYNPTRPFTPEGAVGIAGPCLAIYPVPSPGGYQLIGRTIPIYDAQQRNPAFADNPILMKPGDRVTFTRCTDDELIALRERVYDGSYQYQIEDGVLDVGDYLAGLQAIEPEAEAFRRRQQEAAEQTPLP
ncbi:MAG: carboxyltransferase domain-containing protein [Thermomicrobiales bacterium]|nr:carboxyltransferase domain-containing protein [Thermomicrobiales bacterium]